MTSAATNSATNAEPERNDGAYSTRSATSENSSSGGSARANRRPVARWNSSAHSIRERGSSCRFTFGVRKTGCAAPSRARTESEMPIAPCRIPAASTPYSFSVSYFTNQPAYGARKASGRSHAPNRQISGGSRSAFLRWSGCRSARRTPGVASRLADTRTRSAPSTA
jgi:hypothetical protein